MHRRKKSELDARAEQVRDKVADVGQGTSLLHWQAYAEQRLSCQVDDYDPWARPIQLKPAVHQTEAALVLNRGQ